MKLGSRTSKLGSRWAKLGHIARPTSSIGLYDYIAALASTGYPADTARAGIDQLPSLVIGRPRGERMPSRIGAQPYRYDIPCTLYSDMAVAHDAYDEQADLLEAFVRAVDADHTLGARVEEAVVTDWDIPTPNRSAHRPTLSTTATLTLVVV